MNVILLEQLEINKTLPIWIGCLDGQICINLVLSTLRFGSWQKTRLQNQNSLLKELSDYLKGSPRETRSRML